MRLRMTLTFRSFFSHHPLPSLVLEERVCSTMLGLFNAGDETQALLVVHGLFSQCPCFKEILQLHTEI